MSEENKKSILKNKLGHTEKTNQEQEKATKTKYRVRFGDEDYVQTFENTEEQIEYRKSVPKDKLNKRQNVAIFSISQGSDLFKELMEEQLPQAQEPALKEKEERLNLPKISQNKEEGSWTSQFSTQKSKASQEKNLHLPEISNPKKDNVETKWAKQYPKKDNSVKLPDINKGGIGRG